MARLPDVMDLGAPVVPRRARGIVSDQSGQIAAEAVGNFAGAVGNIANQFREREDKFSYALAKSKLLQADIQTRKSLEDDPDFETYEKRYQESMTKALDESNKLIRGSRDRALFDMDAKLDVERGMEDIRAKAKVKKVDWARATLDDNLDGLRNSALQSDDEITRETNIGTMGELIDGAAENGFITQQERVNLRQAKTTDFAEAWLSTQTPARQVELLSNPKANGAAVLRFIPLDKQSKLLESAQRDYLTQENIAYQLSERERKKFADSLSKQGDEMLANGQLTPGWIEKNKGALDAADVRYFYGKLSGDGGEGPRDSMRYVDLRDRVSRGEDVRDEARDALRKGSIRTSDYNLLVNEVEQQRPNWYKRGASYISTSAAVSDVNPDPAGAQRKAAMLDDWNNWADQNQKATDKEAQEAYRRIVKEYAIVERDKMIILKRAPQFFVGDRSKPDFDATEAATVRAYQEKRLTDEEFAQQAALIKEWRSMYHIADSK